MVKAEDLRKGNLIYGVSDRIEQIVDIEGIGVVRTKLLKLQTDTLFGSHCDEISPIPLTPDILEKCGFEKLDMADLGYFIGMKFSDRLSINFSSSTIWIDEHDTGIQYLHQLQNLYYILTNTELTINL